MKTVVIDGKKIDLSCLSDEQLENLLQKMQQREENLKERMEQYREKYPFLGDIEIGG